MDYLLIAWKLLGRASCDLDSEVIVNDDIALKAHAECFRNIDARFYGVAGSWHKGAGIVCFVVIKVWAHAVKHGVYVMAGSMHKVLSKALFLDDCAAYIVDIAS